METRATWQPWQEMRRLQREMEHLFGDLTPSWRWPLTGEYPPMNLTRDDQGIVLEALCPGADRETLETTVVGDAVTVRGERRAEPEGLLIRGEQHEQHEEHEDHRKDLYVAERRYKSFARTVPLPPGLDLDRAEARVKHGVLAIRVPKAAARPGRVSWPR